MYINDRELFISRGKGIAANHCLHCWDNTPLHSAGSLGLEWIMLKKKETFWGIELSATILMRYNNKKHYDRVKVQLK